MSVIRILPRDRALAELRALQRPRQYFLEKRSALDGSQETGFEQALSTLGHSYMAEKAPKLLPYELGFQLVEKNDDGTRAVGIFAFKVGTQFLYAPVFYLNGDLKGHELLYIKNQDLFVPLRDDWVTYLLGRKPLDLGDNVNRNLASLGVQGPNFYQLARSPQKYASVHEDWKQAALAEVAHFATTSPSVAFAGKPFDLGQFVKTAGSWAYRGLLQLCQARPTLVQEVDRYHPGLLEEGARLYGAQAKQASVRRWDSGATPRDVLSRVRVEKIESGQDALDAIPSYTRNEMPHRRRQRSLLETMEQGAQTKQAGKRKGKVEAYMDDGPDVRDLTAPEKEQLLRKRYYIRDSRDDEEINKAYDTTVPLRLHNPDETNLYQVLLAPDRFATCLVLMHPYSNHGRHHLCTVIELESKRWCNTHPTNVWVRASGSKESFQKWYDDLPEPDGDPGGLVVLLTANGEGTVPFRLSERHGSVVNAENSGLWEVSFRHYAASESDGLSTIRDHNSPFFTYSSERYPSAERVRFTGKTGGRMAVRGRGELWVPADIKILKLPGKPGVSSDEDCCAPCEYTSEPGPLEPGNLADVQLLLHDTTYPLQVTARKEQVTLKSGAAQTPVLTPEQAIVALVTQHNLREKTAAALVQRAQERGAVYCRVKAANTTANMITEAPSAPGFPEMPVGYDPMTGGRYPTQEATSWALPVNDLLTNLNNREAYNPLIPPDHSALQSVEQAAQTGQREIFDTAALGSLLKSVRDDSVIDRYLPELLKGMNALGRLLFSFYWHQDNFADRYGKADLREIEDGLRNAFESIGEILLTLKARTVNPALDEGLGSDDSLEDVANV